MLKIMVRRREVVEEVHENEFDLEEVVEEEEEGYHGKSGRRKRSRSDFIHGSAIEKDAEDEGDAEESDGKKKKKKKGGLSEIFDLEAIVRSDDEDEKENDAEDDFINDAGAEIAGDDVYVEADKEAHVQEAVRGMCNIFSTVKIMHDPIKEMTDVLSVESKRVDLARDSWVRMKLGIYKGDLAKVVDVDYVRQKVTVKLIPRVDLQSIAAKLEGRDVPIKKACLPPPRFFNVDEAREMHIHVEKRRDRATGATFEFVDKMMFKDGFLYKTVSLKSVNTNATKEDIRVLADNVVRSSEVSSGKTSLGGFELQDLVLMDNSTFGVIIGMGNDVFQVLKGIPDRREVALIKLKEVKRKVDGQSIGEDSYGNYISAKDTVKVLEGPFKRKQGVVLHIYRGVIFIHDRGRLEDGGFICAKAQSCGRVGGKHMRNDLKPLDPRMDAHEFVGGRLRGGRGYLSLVGKRTKIRSGPWKGQHGYVTDVTRAYVLVELDAQMEVYVDKKDIDDGSATAFQFRKSTLTLYGMGSVTPMHPSRSETPMCPSRSETPMHYQTPMIGPPGGGLEPKVDDDLYIADGDGNWLARDDGNWLVRDIYVNVLRPGEEPLLGVISEVNTDGSCRVALGGDGDEMETLLMGEMEPARPKKSDRVKIISGAHRGLNGKLMGVDEDDGIVKLDGTFDIKVLEMSSLAKLAT